MESGIFRPSDRLRLVRLACWREERLLSFTADSKPEVKR
ncbi:hypothetical protein AM1_5630 [Acaryochloris marina MBIC11017]|uniref:Uncharacterized protein n=1 Tax=Acaryochloris marina (strain MBIC 11017) TaxID=329726 RepID=B0CF64_ACAM1|nr:hypothetical protein AM1_5630 [Acaryochloris marina MBIC11017]